MTRYLLFTLFALVAHSFGQQQCSNHFTCDACTNDQCTWCPSSKTCTLYSCDGPVISDNFDCDCLKKTTCSDCTYSAFCNWCSDDDSCQPQNFSCDNVIYTCSDSTASLAAGWIIFFVFISVCPCFIICCIIAIAVTASRRRNRGLAYNNTTVAYTTVPAYGSMPSNPAPYPPSAPYPASTSSAPYPASAPPPYTG